MFVFPFGIPISAFVILYRNREKILAGDKATLKQFDMLIDDYNLDCYYWEIVELVRKLLLAGVLMFIGRGSPLQGAGGICIAFVFFAWQVKSKPFKLAVHNDIKAIWDAVLFVALLATLLLKTDMRVKTMDNIGLFLAYFILLAMMVPTKQFCSSSPTFLTRLSPPSLPLHTRFSRTVWFTCAHRSCFR